jgi:hypothetical protein
MGSCEYAVFTQFLRNGINKEAAGFTGNSGVHRERSGAGKRNRTPDLLITNELLYRLSYSGVGLNYSEVAFWLRRGIRSRGRLRFYYPK